MKINKNSLLFSRLFFVLALFAIFSFNFKSFVYAADDSLMGLQKDVLAAKEKQAGYADSPQVIDPNAGDPKSARLQQQADNLLGEWDAKGVPADSKEIPPAAAKPASRETYKFNFPSPRSFDTKPGLAPKMPWVFNPMPKFLGYGQQKDYVLTDGDAFYKVAVSDGKLSVREAVEIAMANSFQLQALKKKVEVADSKWTEAKRAMFPTVQFEYDENGGHAPDSQRFYRGRAYKVNATQPLYYGGELVLTAKQAEENLKSSKTDYTKARNDLIQQVRTAYYGVVKTEYNVQYQLEVQKEVAAIYKIVRSGYDQKVIAEVDYLNVDSQYQQSNFLADSTRNDLLAAYLTLRQTMNVDASCDLPVDLRLEFKKYNPDFNRFLDMAMQNNPDILSKQLAYLSAQDGVQIYEAKKKPRFDLRGSYGDLGEVFKDDQAIADGNASLDLEKEWYLGVHGSIPLGANSLEYDQIKHVYGPTVSAFQGSEDWRHTVKFNLLDKFSDITDAKNAAATLLQSQADWQKSRSDVIFKLKDNFYSLQKAMLQMDSAVAKMRYQEKQNGILKYSMSIQETAPGGYLEGLIEQASNRFAFIQAVTDYYLALSNIGATCGDPFYFDDEDEKNS